MKRLLIAFLLLPQLATAQYREKCFTLDLSDEVKEVSVKSSFHNDTVINLPVKTPLSGLSISGVATLKNNSDSYIRVDMKDNYNYEHLVYENYPLLSDELIIPFSNTALETMAMDEVVPTSIRVELHHATIEIKSIQYIESSSERKSSVNPYSIQKAQCEYIANQLNRNLEKRKMTWRAGVTSISEKNYEEKKAMFGGKLPQLYGFDYYKGGIFVLPDSEVSHNSTITQRRNATTNQYVSEWDWRNRHGKNWMTSVKNQNPCNSCWIFAAIGSLEAYINLYYNQITSYTNSDNEQILGYNLSEQEIMSCIDNNSCNSYGTPAKALKYIKENGVVNEECFHYAAADRDCSEKCQIPAERVYLESFDTIPDNTSGEVVKKRLFRAPLPFSIISWRHTMVLTGYKTLASGDVIRLSNNSTMTIPPGSDLIGTTAWLFKNSWGENWGEYGYAYVIVSTSNRYYTNSLKGAISCLQHSENDIVCEDADGDGYYFWGIGPKPANCPSWVPDTPDGDDSDINYGALDEYGNLENLPAGITIRTLTTCTDSISLSHRIGIVDGGLLKITGATTQTGNSKIRVCEGGILIVDGGSLLNANLELVPGSQLIVRNNGTISMASGNPFNAPKGVVVNIEEGIIE
jgi:C1A family cysteine protease